MNNKPFKFSEWIKHAYDFEKDLSPIEEAGNNKVIIMAHPAHPKVHLNLEEDITAQVYKLPKSLQLYFFGLVWIGFCNLEDDTEWNIVEKILISIFDYAKMNPELKRQEMVWDDHALSERACVLIYLMNILKNKDILNYIKEHLKILMFNLDIIIASKKWEGNNHRVFHLCAKWCIEKHFFNDIISAKLYLDKIEEFFLSLIDIETGLSVEQSISYYNFDITLLKMVTMFLGSSEEGFKDPRLEPKRLEKNKDMHLKALAFPDGELPGSGDTPLGIKIKAPLLSDIEKKKLWQSLNRAGHYRGSSKNGSYHFHLISHNGESPHGHMAPLHIDLWIEKIGSVLVDSGGPYKYGDRLRYEWFRSPKAHNTINFIDTESRSSQSTVSVSYINEELKGVIQYGDDFFYRNISSENNTFKITDKVSTTSNWSLSWHFSSGIDVINVSSGEFDILCNGITLKLSILSDLNLDIEICDGYLTYQGGKKVVAPYILVKGLGSGTINTTFNLGVEHEV